MIQHIIEEARSLYEALAKIDTLQNENLTLFVVDSRNNAVGSLTDGDIRRYILSGGQLTDHVSEAMHKNFAFISDNDENVVSLFRRFKKEGIILIPLLNKDRNIIGIFDLKNYKSHLPIDAVLMAGGKGERLRPLTETTPKPLLKVEDKCIIDYNIQSLISYGIKHISVTVNYLKEQLEEHFSTPINDTLVNCVRESKFLGTIGSIKFIKEFYNDTILVMNSDLFTNIDYEDFFIHFKEHDADMSVAAVPYPISIPYGIFDLEGRNIKGLLEKPKYNYYANGGIYLIKKEVLSEIPDDTFFNATDLIEKLISKGKSVIRYPLNGIWIDIGTPQEYAKAQDLGRHLR